MSPRAMSLSWTHDAMISMLPLHAAADDQCGLVEIENIYFNWLSWLLVSF